MDRSGSGGKQRHQKSSNEVIDLSGEPIGGSSGPDASLIEINADEKPDGPTRTSEADRQNHSHSDLQQYDTSGLSGGLESSHGNFNLELEDSDDDEGQDAADTEEEEQKLLTELQLNGSFSVHKSLTESLCRQTGVSGLDRSSNESANESIVGTKRKRAAMIYDSDEEEQQLVGSFQALGSSTPKMSPPRSRRSVAGNTSVVSNRSLLQSVIQDSEEDESDEEEAEKMLGMNSEQEVMAGETLLTEEEEDDEDDDDYRMEDDVDEDDEESSERLSAAGGDSMAGSAQDEPQPEEEQSCHGNGASPECLTLEESSVEPELAPGEQMDRCASSGADPDSYESLVRSGKEKISQNRPDDALDFFLRAIDLQPGDPEVQLITIQLYRQLSHRR